MFSIDPVKSLYCLLLILVVSENDEEQAQSLV